MVVSFVMRKEITRVFKDSTVYGLGSLLPKAAAIVLTPIYTAYLTPTDYGVMAFAMMVSSMLGIVMTLGQNGSLVLFYRRTAEHAEDRRETLFTVFWFVVIFGAVILGLGFLIGPSVTHTLAGSKQVPFNPYLALALLIAFISLPQAMQQSINRALGQAKLFTAFQLTMFALNTGFTLYFVVALRQGAYGSMKGTLIAALIIFRACLDRG
jgi:O-antigen/teichoic acid export membrane protein